MGGWFFLSDMRRHAGGMRQYFIIIFVCIAMMWISGRISRSWIVDHYFKAGTECCPQFCTFPNSPRLQMESKTTSNCKNCIPVVAGSILAPLMISKSWECSTQSVVYLMIIIPSVTPLLLHISSDRLSADWIVVLSESDKQSHQTRTTKDFVMKIAGNRATVFFIYCVQQQQCLHTGPELAKH